jgi:hypothetical protein
LKDDLSQIYDYLTKQADDQSKSEQSISPLDLQSIMASSKKKRVNKELSKIVE